MAAFLLLEAGAIPSVTGPLAGGRCWSQTSTPPGPFPRTPQSIKAPAPVAGRSVTIRA